MAQNLNTTQCVDGYRRESEFTLHSECRVVIQTALILKVIVITAAALCLGIELVLLGRNWRDVQSKNWSIRVLIYWLLLHGPLMVLRPLLSLVLDQHSSTSVGMQVLTHLGGASAACSIILFMSIELDLLLRGSVRKANLQKRWMFAQKHVILGGVAVVSLVVFGIGPILRVTTDYRIHILFWQAVVFTNVTIIPLFTYLGMTLYMKISKIQTDKFARLSRHIKTTILICIALGLSAGAAAVYLMIDTRIEWILVECVWLFDILFSVFLYIVIARRAERKLVSSSSPTGSDTGTGKHSKMSQVSGSDDVGSRSLGGERVSSIVVETVIA